MQLFTSVPLFSCFCLPPSDGHTIATTEATSGTWSLSHSHIWPSLLINRCCLAVKWKKLETSHTMPTKCWNCSSSKWNFCKEIRQTSIVDLSPCVSILLYYSTFIMQWNPRRSSHSPSLASRSILRHIILFMPFCIPATPSPPSDCLCISFSLNGWLCTRYKCKYCKMLRNL